MRKPLQEWLTWWHGDGEPHQALFYRCLLCRQIVTWKHIRSGGCPCGASRLSPTNPRFGEAVRLLLFPWTI